MKIALSLKVDMYQDILTIAELTNSNPSKVLREMLEQEPTKTLLHETAILLQAESIKRKRENQGT